MAKTRTHYDNLKVARNAPVSVIKAAYKALCQTYHPDKFQGNKEEAERIMKIINASYTVLIDPVKREVHDAWIRGQEEKAKQQNEKAQVGTTGKATEQQYYQEQKRNDAQEPEKSSSVKNSHPSNESVNIKPKQRQFIYKILIVIWGLLLVSYLVVSGIFADFYSGLKDSFLHQGLKGYLYLALALLWIGLNTTQERQQYCQKPDTRRKDNPLSSHEIKSSPINWHKWMSNIAFLMWGAALIGIVILSILGEIKRKEETTIPNQVQTTSTGLAKNQSTASSNIKTAEDISQTDTFNIENDIRNSAEILNKNLPMTIDRNYRLDNVIAGPGLLFTYNYTILTVTSREIDQAYLQDNKHDLKAEICSQPDMKIFFENKVITRYSYRGSDGGFIGNIDITPRDCGYGI